MLMTRSNLRRSRRPRASGSGARRTGRGRPSDVRRTSAAGTQEHYFTTRLTDSTIVDMKLHMPHCQDPAKREFTQLLEVSLAYRKIEWEHVKSGTSGADDWRAPLEA